MKAMYTAVVKATGGREGRVRSFDDVLNLSLAIPKEMGGPGGNATNPEQLFAAGYAACFESALRHVARTTKKASIKEGSVTAHVGIGHNDRGAGFKLAVKLEVSLPGLDRALAEELVAEAHQVCPYSNATRGNVDVDIAVV